MGLRFDKMLEVLCHLLMHRNGFGGKQLLPGIQDS